MQPIRVLTPEQMERIDAAAVKILEETGMIIQSEEALKLLEKCGCAVDHAAQHVKFPPRVVREAVAKMKAGYARADRPEHLRRGYVTVIRQNWHLLPDRQIIQLLGWTPEKYSYILKEDDFLSEKLGPKPACEPVVWASPDAAPDKKKVHLPRTSSTR